VSNAFVHDRRITHAETVYRPGERALAAKVLELLGCRVVDRGGHFFTALVDPEVTSWTTNTIYASEVTPRQWAFEQALQEAAGTNATLGAARDAWLADVTARPQYSFHFGLRVANDEAFESLLDRVRHAQAHDPELAGRIHVSGVFRPGDPDAATDTMLQAFIHTDVIASGLVSLGQHIEIQRHLV